MKNNGIQNLVFDGKPIEHLTRERLLNDWYPKRMFKGELEWALMCFVSEIEILKYLPLDERPDRKANDGEIVYYQGEAIRIIPYKITETTDQSTYFPPIPLVDYDTVVFVGFGPKSTETRILGYATSNEIYDFLLG